MQNNSNNISLTEKELMSDLLMTEKHGTESYTVGITESSCSNLRQVLTKCEQNIFNCQENVFNAMNQRGWYNIKQSDTQEVQQAKDKFNQIQNELT
ncbi:MAG: spore coat protein [Clostridia bacterium]|nr:spore coat protein [Clostridia bacterium]